MTEGRPAAVAQVVDDPDGLLGGVRVGLALGVALDQGLIRHIGRPSLVAGLVRRIPAPARTLDKSATTSGSVYAFVKNNAYWTRPFRPDPRPRTSGSPASPRTCAGPVAENGP
ncbi:hypothetical protein ACFXKI_49215 [Streptomyces mirabilis]|uniref:hypothetical protein n=1 Tax=Streptomyces mirabilis TaxID=68239 RepID=UPI003681C21C